MIKALLTALVLTGAPVAASAPAAPAPQIVGFVGFAIDHVPQALMFVYSNGTLSGAIPADDCAAVAVCKDEVALLVKTQHYRILDVEDGKRST